MIEKSSGKPPDKLHWVFSGSTLRRAAPSPLSREAGRDEGRFAADIDGTVICVVDFDSALISLPARHSSDDAELWLLANPSAIPPLGTRCTLVIRSAFDPKVEAHLSQDGRLQMDGQTVSVESVVNRLVRSEDARTPRLVILWEGSSRSADVGDQIGEIERELQRRNLDPVQSLVIRSRPESKTDPPGEK